MKEERCEECGEILDNCDCEAEEDCECELCGYPHETVDCQNTLCGKCFENVENCDCEECIEIDAAEWIALGKPTPK